MMKNKLRELESTVIDADSRILCKCTECSKEFSDQLVFKSAYDDLKAKADRLAEALEFYYRNYFRSEKIKQILAEYRKEGRE